MYLPAAGYVDEQENVLFSPLLLRELKTTFFGLQESSVDEQWV